jgi:endonuclease III
MPDFWKTIEKLRKVYGRLSTATRDPFELILHENIAYLVSDDRRERAFRELKERVGLRPADILTASIEELAEITATGGIFPQLRARRLQESARLVRDRFGGDLRSVLKLDRAQARKALKEFPTIGDPGADKILLFSGTVPTLAPESNGLRALVRLGFTNENKNYAAMYRSLQKSLEDQAGEACASLMMAHRLLKRHGQEICKRTAPRCHACALRVSCPAAG